MIDLLILLTALCTLLVNVLGLSVLLFNRPHAFVQVVRTLRRQGDVCTAPRSTRAALDPLFQGWV